MLVVTPIFLGCTTKNFQESNAFPSYVCKHMGTAYYFVRVHAHRRNYDIALELAKCAQIPAWCNEYHLKDTELFIKPFGAFWGPQAGAQGLGPRLVPASHDVAQCQIRQCGCGPSTSITFLIGDSVPHGSLVGDPWAAALQLPCSIDMPPQFKISRGFKAGH